MTSGEDAILIHKSIIRGHHVYNDIWKPKMGEILEVQREPENEHDCQAVHLLKSSAIVGSIVVDNSQLELSSAAFPLAPNPFEGKTEVPATIAIIKASHPIVGVDSISCVSILIRRMRLTASSKTREEVCTYDKMCTYTKGALNNPSLRYILEFLVEKISRLLRKRESTCITSL